MEPQSPYQADPADQCAVNRKAAKDSGPHHIPHRSAAKFRLKVFPKLLYGAGARIEQEIGRRKRVERGALRGEKTARNSRACVEIAAAFISIKSLHRA